MTALDCLFPVLLCIVQLLGKQSVKGDGHPNGTLCKPGMHYFFLTSRMLSLPMAVALVVPLLCWDLESAQRRIAVPVALDAPPLLI